jgi:hypothetical protein
MRACAGVEMVVVSTRKMSVATYQRQSSAPAILAPEERQRRPQHHRRRARSVASQPTAMTSATNVGPTHAARQIAHEQDSHSHRQRQGQVDGGGKPNTDGCHEPNAEWNRSGDERARDRGREQRPDPEQPGDRMTRRQWFRDRAFLRPPGLSSNPSDAHLTPL